MNSNGAPRAATYSSRNFLRRSAFVAVIRVSGLFFVFLLQVVLARLIGNGEEYGVYAWGQSLMFLAGSLACLGLPVITNRFIAALRTQRDEQGIINVVRTSRVLLLRASGVLVLVALLVNLAWRDAPDGQHYRNVASLAFLLAPGVTFAYLYLDYCRARQWLGLALLPLNVIRPLVTGALVYGAWRLSGARLSGELVMGLAGGSVLAVLLPQMFIFHRRSRRLAASSGTASSAPGDYHPSQLFRTSLPVFAVRCAALTIRYSNVLLVGFLAGPAAAGAYFAAERLAQLAAIPQSVVGSVNQQSMAAAHATHNAAGVQKIVTQSAHGSLWPTLLVAIGLAVLATPLLQLFGDDFSNGKDDTHHAGHRQRDRRRHGSGAGCADHDRAAAASPPYHAARCHRAPRRAHPARACLRRGWAQRSPVSPAALVGAFLSMRVAQQEMGISTTVLRSLRR
jgi:O-antigen/teichoic acid export membrane protein